MKEGACKVELSDAGVKAFLKFVYYSDLADPLKSSEVAFELLEAGHKYAIRSLEASMLELFIQQTWLGDNVDLLIRLFLLSLRVGGDRYQILKYRVTEMLKS